MIKVCSCCSNVNLDELRNIVEESQLEVGCIEQCQGFDGRSFGFVNEELVTSDDSEAFIEIVKKSL